MKDYYLSVTSFLTLVSLCGEALFLSTVCESAVQPPDVRHQHFDLLFLRHGRFAV